MRTLAYILAALICGAILGYRYAPQYLVPNAKGVITRVVDRPVSIPVPPVYFGELKGYPVYLPSDTIYKAYGIECSSFAVDTILRGDTLSVTADCYQKALKNFELRLKPVQATVRDSFIYERETVTYNPFLTVNASAGHTINTSLVGAWEFGLNTSLNFGHLALVPELSYNLQSGLAGKASLEFTIWEK